ncbi:MAG: phosphonate ABC transporter substrate-binding protein [Rhizobiales bacterium]|nr:phosphonate ABC transporter substrate-binding protein [Hyphomicrobiales bacterium]
MSFHRRLVIAGAFSLLSAASAQAQKAPQELVFAVIPSENSEGVVNRYTPFTEYLTRELGMKVSLRIASDYAAVIEGQRAGNIHIAHYGPAAFARALAIGSPVEAFGQQVNTDGTRGYYSVFYTRANSPINSIEDARGKVLCLVDPNSASGNQVPRFALSRKGIDPEKHFSKVVYTGSHENAVIGLQQGSCEVAANWWNNEKRSNLLRMAGKGMVKAEDFRIVFRSELIPNSPVAYIKSLPDDLKAKIRVAFMEIGTRAPDVWKHISDGTSQPWQPASNDTFQMMIELNRFVDDLRKKGS